MTCLVSLYSARERSPVERFHGLGEPGEGQELGAGRRALRVEIAMAQHRQTEDRIVAHVGERIGPVRASEADRGGVRAGAPLGLCDTRAAT